MSHSQATGARDSSGGDGSGTGFAITIGEEVGRFLRAGTNE